MREPRRKSRAEKDAIKAGRERRISDREAFRRLQAMLLDPAFGRVGVRRIDEARARRVMEEARRTIPRQTGSLSPTPKETR